MKQHRLRRLCLGALVWGLSAAAQASLIGVLPATPGGTDYQAYYDNVANLTWLANANANGVMGWTAANAWAAGLNINGVTGWRLPLTAQPDATCGGQINPGGGFPLQGFGFNCTGSEMGNLFYNVLGGVAGQNLANTHNSNYDLFTNIQPNYYWSATEYGPDTDDAWYFLFFYGGQYYSNKANGLYAWAVRPGNVAGAPGGGGTVPEPGTLLLMGAGLMGIAARRRSALR